MQEKKGTWASCLQQSPENDTFFLKHPLNTIFQGEVFTI